MNVRVAQTRRRVLRYFPFFALAFLTLAAVGAQEQTKVSEPGKYRGYSQPVYNEWVRTSQYVSVRDGSKLAVDIFRPAQGGQPVSEPLPVIWTHDRYQRANGRAPRINTQLDEEPWLQTVLKHGYVIAVADIRGTGASYGTWPGPFSQAEATDAYDLTEWFAAQPWCSGNVGMYGRSYLGITQYMAAAQAPPHLKAIFPEMALFDLYSFVNPGGVFRNDFGSGWSRFVKEMDTNGQAAPVDEDGNGVMLTQALEAHKSNINISDMFAALPYRDSRGAKNNSLPYLDRSPSSHLSQVKKSGVAIYHLAGWYDLWPRDALLWFNNLDNPQKIIIGPWYHAQSTGLNMSAEHLRWYDYWLKGIDNGIMAEAPIRYYTVGAPEGQEWRSATQWPLPNEQPTQFYFQGGPSGSVKSVNDGLLSPQPPTDDGGRDDYTVDYLTTSGTATRWTNGYGGALGYRSMTPNDEKGLTYTTRLLDSDVEVTGHPVIHLWVTSTASDGDFFVYLEEVHESGFSQYVTEGTLRASHRATSPAPYNYINLPYHPSYKKDLVDLPGEPVELVFDLHPISNVFDAGNRIRVTVTGADKDNALTPTASPPPTVSLHRRTVNPSRIILPVIPTAAATPKTQSPVASLQPGGTNWPVVTIILALAVSAAAFAVWLLKFRKKRL